MSFIKRLLQGKIDQVKDWQDPDREEDPMACPEITVPQVDKVLHDKLLLDAEAAGAKFEGTLVTLEGITLDWNYDAEAQVLHITATAKPFYIGCGQIQSKIQELITKAREGSL